MYALLVSALFLRAATTASSVDWMPEEERLMVHEFANWTGLLRINASSLAKHNMLAITLLYFVKDVDDAKPSNDQGIVSGPKGTHGTIGFKRWTSVRNGDEWLLQSSEGRFYNEEEGMDAEIAVTHPGSPISQITYRLASSPPFVIAMVGHRGVNNGVFSAERGYEGTDPTQWWALEPRVLSRWIHGKTYLSDEHIYSTEVQIELFAMPFDTSEEVIRCLCYVLGVKPHDLKRRRNSPSPHSEYDARVTAGQDHGAEL